MLPSRTRIKMCGMTRIEDIDHAVALGVDAIGLIFYHDSKRNVTLEQAKKLIRCLPPFVDAVAVLVNPDKEFVQRLIDELPLQLLQFHGDETPDFCQRFNMPFIKSMHPENADQILHVMQRFDKAQGILLDTPSDTLRGGTGRVFDWTMIPRDLPKPCVLAGGLTEDNVLNAIEVCSPWALDVCSGIERLPGVKDHEKMTRFMQSLRGKG